MPAEVQNARALFGLRRVFSGREAKEAAERASVYLRELHTWARTQDVARLLGRMRSSAQPVGRVDAAAALDESVGLRAFLPLTGSPALSPVSVLNGLPTALAVIDETLKNESIFRQRALDAGMALRRAETDRLIVEMPIDRLKDATRERVRLSPLQAAGYNTVHDVLSYSSRISTLQGVGAISAQRIRGAARTLWQSTFDEMPTRIDVANPTAATRELVSALDAWDGSRRTRNAWTDLARAEALRPLANALRSDDTHLLLMPGAGGSGAIREAVDAVIARADAISRSSARGGHSDPWADFLARPADYFAMLSELGFLVEDDDVVAGGLPEEIVSAVREFELETKYLTAALRGYQAFAARFALVQRKVVIGDEMGLGKTVEALAVMAHLAAKGSHHALVVCPAAVVTNWMREIAGKSALQPHRLHGVARDGALRSWRRQGGVGVTTYESLGWLEPHLGPQIDLACVVLDEAHYIKNPSSLRARRSAALITRAERALLLTGTPLENRVEEFRNLVAYLRPDLLVDASDLRPRLFRQQVAPAYLRRNQEDVLTELPDLVEVEEWLPMSPADLRAYRSAVYNRSFHDMRQVCMLQGAESEKLRRLIEIVEEAEENGRRVLVFSYYLSVLRAAAEALPGRIFGPLTGSVPAAARQTMVDHFSAAQAGAVLIAQIGAGGVGLNIQAASVVIICEPQLKPTTEWQAIARARRMGQLQSVQVYRLLSEAGVDARVTEILARKTAIFDDFAAVSDTAASAPEAFDVSEADLVREVVDAERHRLFAGLADIDTPV